MVLILILWETSNTRFHASEAGLAISDGGGNLGRIEGLGQVP